MNIGLILAGGVGARMHQNIPKQFINVEDKPVIVYTMAAFQRHPDINEIFVVCLEGWGDILKAYAQQFNIDKLKGVVPGGQTGQESIRNGIFAIAQDHNDDDLILIHDGIRPMLSTDIISDCIVTAQRYGNAVVAIPCTEVMLMTEDGETSTKNINRDLLKRTQTPQAFKLGDLVTVHKKALEMGITNETASASMFANLGYTIHFSQGSEKNLKLTTSEDIDIFKALLHAKRPEWMKG